MIKLVTGGSGFLGAALIKRLIEQGSQVRSYDLARSPGLLAPAEFIEGDVRDLEKIRGAIKDCSTVYHLVGIMPQAKAGPEVMQAVNVTGTENVLKASSEAGVKKLIYLSSNEVYGDNHCSPNFEDSPKNPLGEYARNKIEAEALCQEYSRKYGMAVTIIRPSTLVAAGITERFFLFALNALSKGIPLGYPHPGKNKFQMTYLHDCVSACLLAEEKILSACEVFNIGADDTLSWKEQIQELGRLTGKSKFIIPIPFKLIKPVFQFLDWIGLPLLEKEHYMLMEKDVLMDCAKARQMLGWRPTKTNVEMLMETYQWYLETQKK